MQLRERCPIAKRRDGGAGSTRDSVEQGVGLDNGSDVDRAGLGWEPTSAMVIHRQSLTHTQTHADIAKLKLMHLKSAASASNWNAYHYY